MQRHPDSSGLEAGDASSRLVNNTTRVSWRLEPARRKPSRVQVLWVYQTGSVFLCIWEVRERGWWRACRRLQSVVRWGKDDTPLGTCKLELSRCSFSVVCRILYLGHRNSTGLPVSSIESASREYRVPDVALGQSEGRLGGHPSGHVRYSGPVRRTNSLAEVLTVPLGSSPRV